MLPEAEKTWVLLENDYKDVKNEKGRYFLICYLAVLLTRLLQFKILKNQYCSEEILDFAKGFKVVKIFDRKYINLAKMDPFIKDFSMITFLPLTSYFLSDGQVKKGLFPPMPFR